MREYLFHGKRIDNGEWVEGFFVNVDGDSFILSGKFGIINGHFGYVQYRVDPETVGQYTGMNVRGEKIFEGDIVKITDKYNNSVIYIVECFMGAFALKQKGVNYRAQFVDFHLRPYDFEVIGNVHDNPELLKEGGE